MDRTRVKSLMIDALLIACALTDGLLYLGETASFEVTVAIVSSAGLALRRRWPWVSLLLALPALVLTFSSVAGLVALYSIAVKERRRWSVILAGLAVLAGTVSTSWGTDLTGSVVASILYAVMATAAPIALGLLVRTRSELTQRLHELERVKESERLHANEEILAAERARIAREMHDVVSHQVSLLAVQAGALQVASSSPEQVTNAARTMRALAVKTLDELRQMVTVLRATGAVSQLAPQPTIQDIPDLIKNSGITCITELDLPEGLPASVQRAIYRTIQEALTNIRKHSPKATAHITTTTTSSLITITVYNTRSEGPSMRLPSAGHGLIGLRERAELIGGKLTAQGDESGGFVLKLMIPRT